MVRQHSRDKAREDSEQVKWHDLYDKRGRQIKPFDVLKMFHFIGSRRKKYFMYKWVIVKNGHLYGHHLDGTEGMFLLTQRRRLSKRLDFCDAVCYTARRVKLCKGL